MGDYSGENTSDVLDLIRDSIASSKYEGGYIAEAVLAAALKKSQERGATAEDVFSAAKAAASSFIMEGNSISDDVLSARDIAINAGGRILNSADLIADRSLQMSAGDKAVLDGRLLGGADVDVSSSPGIVNTGRLISESGFISIESEGSFENRGEIISSSLLEIKAGAGIVNDGGSLESEDGFASLLSGGNIENINNASMKGYRALMLDSVGGKVINKNSDLFGVYSLSIESGYDSDVELGADGDGRSSVKSGMFLDISSGRDILIAKEVLLASGLDVSLNALNKIELLGSLKAARNISMDAEGIGVGDNAIELGVDSQLMAGFSINAGTGNDKDFLGAGKIVIGALDPLAILFTGDDGSIEKELYGSGLAGELSGIIDSYASGYAGQGSFFIQSEGGISFSENSSVDVGASNLYAIASGGDFLNEGLIDVDGGFIDIIAGSAEEEGELEEFASLRIGGSIINKGTIRADSFSLRAYSDDDDLSGVINNLGQISSSAVGGEGYASSLIVADSDILNTGLIEGGGSESLLSIISNSGSVSNAGADIVSGGSVMISVYDKFENIDSATLMGSWVSVGAGTDAASDDSDDTSASIINTSGSLIQASEMIKLVAGLEWFRSGSIDVSNGVLSTKLPDSNLYLLATDEIDMTSSVLSGANIAVNAEKDVLYGGAVIEATVGSGLGSQNSVSIVSEKGSILSPKGGAVSIKSSGDIYLNADVKLALSSAKVEAANSGSLRLVSSGSGDDNSLNANNAVFSGGNIGINAKSDINLDNSVFLATSLADDGGSGMWVVSDGGNLTASNVDIKSSGDIYFSIEDGMLDLEKSVASASGNFSVRALGDILASDLTLDFGEAISLNNQLGDLSDISLDGASFKSGAGLHVASGRNAFIKRASIFAYGDVTLSAGGSGSSDEALQLGGSIFGGGGDIVAGGDIRLLAYKGKVSSISNDIEGGGTVSFEAFGEQVIQSSADGFLRVIADEDIVLGTDIDVSAGIIGIYAEGDIKASGANIIAHATAKEIAAYYDENYGVDEDRDVSGALTLSSVEGDIALGADSRSSFLGDGVSLYASNGRVDLSNAVVSAFDEHSYSRYVRIISDGDIDLSNSFVRANSVALSAKAGDINKNYGDIYGLESVSLVAGSYDYKTKEVLEAASISSIGGSIISGGSLNVVAYGKEDEYGVWRGGDLELGDGSQLRASSLDSLSINLSGRFIGGVGTKLSGGKVSIVATKGVDALDSEIVAFANAKQIAAIELRPYGVDVSDLTAEDIESAGPGVMISSNEGSVNLGANSGGNASLVVGDGIYLSAVAGDVDLNNSVIGSVSDAMYSRYVQVFSGGNLNLDNSSVQGKTVVLRADDGDISNIGGDIYGVDYVSLTAGSYDIDLGELSGFGSIDSRGASIISGGGISIRAHGEKGEDGVWQGGDFNISKDENGFGGELVASKSSNLSVVLDNKFSAGDGVKVHGGVIQLSAVNGISAVSAEIIAHANAKQIEDMLGQSMSALSISSESGSIKLGGEASALIGDGIYLSAVAGDVDLNNSVIGSVSDAMYSRYVQVFSGGNLNLDNSSVQGETVVLRANDGDISNIGGDIYGVNYVSLTAGSYDFDLGELSGLGSIDSRGASIISGGGISIRAHGEKSEDGVWQGGDFNISKGGNGFGGELMASKSSNLSVVLDNEFLAGDGVKVHGGVIQLSAVNDISAASAEIIAYANAKQIENIAGTSIAGLNISSKEGSLDLGAESSVLIGDGVSLTALAGAISIDNSNIGSLSGVFDSRYVNILAKEKIDLSNSVVRGEILNLSAKEGDILNIGGDIYGANSVSLTAGSYDFNLGEISGLGSIDSRGASIISGGDISIRAYGEENEAGVWQGGDFNISKDKDGSGGELIGSAVAMLDVILDSKFIASGSDVRGGKIAISADYGVEALGANIRAYANAKQIAAIELRPYGIDVSDLTADDIKNARHGLFIASEMGSINLGNSGDGEHSELIGDGVYLKALEGAIKVDNSIIGAAGDRYSNAIASRYVQIITKDELDLSNSTVKGRVVSLGAKAGDVLAGASDIYGTDYVSLSAGGGSFNTESDEDIINAGSIYAAGASVQSLGDVRVIALSREVDGELKGGDFFLADSVTGEAGKLKAGISGVLNLEIGNDFIGGRGAEIEAGKISIVAGGNISAEDASLVTHFNSKQMRAYGSQASLLLHSKSGEAGISLGGENGEIIANSIRIEASEGEITLKDDLNLRARVGEEGEDIENIKDQLGFIELIAKGDISANGLNVFDVSRVEITSRRGAVFANGLEIGFRDSLSVKASKGIDIDNADLRGFGDIDILSVAGDVSARGIQLESFSKDSTASLRALSGDLDLGEEAVYIDSGTVNIRGVNIIGGDGGDNNIISRRYSVEYGQRGYNDDIEDDKYNELVQLVKDLGIETDVDVESSDFMADFKVDAKWAIASLGISTTDLQTKKSATHELSNQKSSILGAKISESLANFNRAFTSAWSLLGRQGKDNVFNLLALGLGEDGLSSEAISSGDASIFSDLLAKLSYAEGRADCEGGVNCTRQTDSFLDKQLALLKDATDNKFGAGNENSLFSTIYSALDDLRDVLKDGAGSALAWDSAEQSFLEISDIDNMDYTHEGSFEGAYSLVATELGQLIGSGDLSVTNKIFSGYGDLVIDTGAGVITDQFYANNLLLSGALSLSQDATIDRANNDFFAAGESFSIKELTLESRDGNIINTGIDIFIPSDELHLIAGGDIETNIFSAANDPMDSITLDAKGVINFENENDDEKIRLYASDALRIAQGSDISTAELIENIDLAARNLSIESYDGSFINDSGQTLYAEHDLNIVAKNNIINYDGASIIAGNITMEAIYGDVYNAARKIQTVSQGQSSVTRGGNAGTICSYGTVNSESYDCTSSTILNVSTDDSVFTITNAFNGEDNTASDFNSVTSNSIDYAWTQTVKTTTRSGGGTREDGTRDDSRTTVSRQSTTYDPTAGLIANNYDLVFDGEVGAASTITATSGNIDIRAGGDISNLSSSITATKGNVFREAKGDIIDKTLSVFSGLVVMPSEEVSAEFDIDSLIVQVLSDPTSYSTRGEEASLVVARDDADIVQASSVTAAAIGGLVYTKAGGDYMISGASISGEDYIEEIGGSVIEMSLSDIVINNNLSYVNRSYAFTAGFFW